MTIEIVIPQVGEAVAEVTLAEWLKSEGDQVRKGEPLFQVDTDKAVVEVEAFADGTLVEILVQAGSAVLPQQVVALLEPAEETTVPRAVPDRSDEVPHAAPEPSGADVTRIPASPKAGRLAEELGVDLADLVGTGVDGMITVKDVQQAARPIPTPPPAPDGTQRLSKPQPPSKIRKAIARRMALSKTTIPHFYVIRDVDMTQAERLREQASGQDGEKLSYTALFLRACALALRDFPTLNANLRDGCLFLRQTIDIGVAVAATADGGEEETTLIAPVIREVDQKSLREINQELSALVARARSNRLRSQDLEPAGRSLIITNLGMYRVDVFIPIIDPPDPMILAVGTVADRPWVADRELVVRLGATLTLAADHRIMDGATGARFLDRVCELLEQPDILYRYGSGKQKLETSDSGE